MDFKVGSVVTLKSGGPKMTVKELLEPENPDKETLVHCFWFINEQITWGKFNPEMLTVAKEQ